MTHSLGNCCSILLSYGDRVREDTLLVCSSPAHDKVMSLMATAEKRVTSDSVRNHLGLNIFVNDTAIDLP